MKTINHKKISNQTLFYLFVLSYNQNKANIKECIQFHYWNEGSIKKLSIRNISTNLTIFNKSGNSIECTIEFIKNIDDLVSKELIKFERLDGHNIVRLTQKGSDILNDYNIKTIEDLDKKLFEIKPLQNDSNSLNIYNNVLHYLTTRRHTTKRYMPFNFNINKQLMELFLNGLVSIEYRTTKMEIIDSNEVINNPNYHYMMMKYFYYSLVKPFNREEEYFRITQKGLEYLK